MSDKRDKAQLITDSEGLTAERASAVAALNMAVANIADPTDRKRVTRALLAVYDNETHLWEVVEAAMAIRGNQHGPRLTIAQVRTELESQADSDGRLRNVPLSDVLANLSAVSGHGR